MKTTETALKKAELLALIKKCPGKTARELALMTSDAPVSNDRIRWRLHDLKNGEVISCVIVWICSAGRKHARTAFWYAVGDKRARALAQRAAATAQFIARTERERAKKAQSRNGKRPISPAQPKAIHAVGINAEDLAWMAHYRKKWEQRQLLAGRV